MEFTSLLDPLAGQTTMPHDLASDVPAVGAFDVSSDQDTKLAVLSDTLCSAFLVRMWQGLNIHHWLYHEDRSLTYSVGLLCLCRRKY